MDGPTAQPDPDDSRGHRMSSGGSRVPSRGRSRSRTPTAHRWCDILTEALLYFMIVFSPWAFGTTERWSIWTMNATAYALGGLLVTKWTVRWRESWQPDRWDAAPSMETDDPPVGEASALIDDRGRTTDVENWADSQDIGASKDAKLRWRRHRLGTWLTRGLAALTILVLLYTLTSAINARVVYFREDGERFMAYLECVRWLPHSYDQGATWFAFWQYLGLACVFWSLRDWLLTRTAADRGTENGQRMERPMTDDGRPKTEGGGRRTEDGRQRSEVRGQWTGPSTGSGRAADMPRGAVPLPARLRRLLWVLCINGAALALECILQRLSGTPKLLWLVLPHINQDAESQFGPYAYRSNAAQYLNLLWPLCLAFWWHQQQEHSRVRTRTVRAGASAHMLLLPCAALLALGPLVSLSRGGVVIALATLVTSGLVLWLSMPNHRFMHKAIVMALFACILTLGTTLGWQALRPRFELAMRGDMSGREEAYKNATQMLRDHARFGAGPGAFSTVYEHYRGRTDEVIHAYLHDDWMEFQITFGRYGYALILSGLFLLLSSWIFASGIVQPPWFIVLLLLPLLGCLAHARLDFPFQIHSVFLLFVVVSAILSTSSRGR